MKFDIAIYILTLLFVEYFFGFQLINQKWIQNLKIAFHYFSELVKTKPLIHNTLNFDQYLLIIWIFFCFRPFIRKLIRNLKKKTFYLFVELGETNPLMYNNEHFRFKKRPAIPLKIEVWYRLRDRLKRFRNALSKAFRMIYESYDRPIKPENWLATRETIYLSCSKCGGLCVVGVPLPNGRANHHTFTLLVRGNLTNTLQHIHCRPPDTNITTVTYTDDTTILSSHANPHIAQQQVQPYLQEIYDWTRQNQLTLNTSKTTTTLFTPDPAEYNTTLTQQINNTILPTNKEPKILGLTLDPKLTYSKHIKNTTSQANNSHHESTHNNTLREVQRNTQHNIQNNSQTHSRICQHNLVPHHIKNKQITNNTKLSTPNNNRMHTRYKCTPPVHRNKNSPHRHTHETPWITITTTSTRPWTHTATARLKKQTIFHNNNYTTDIDTPPDTTTQETRCRPSKGRRCIPDVDI